MRSQLKWFTKIILINLVFGWSVVFAAGQTVTKDTGSKTKRDPSYVNAEHQHAVELAREDKFNQSLPIFRTLLDKFPQSYAIRRDYVVVLSWSGDCNEAVAQYETIKDHPNPEPYLLSSVSECMTALRDTDRALSLLKSGVRQYPDDEELKDAYKSLLNSTVIDSKPTLTVTTGTTEGEKDSREWYFEAKYTRQWNAQTRWYARTFLVRADDREFDTADLTRVGAGILYWIRRDILLDQEFSAEIDGIGDYGSRTNLTYYPSQLWEISAEYASFAEDIPLRAKAQNIDSDRITLRTDYHTADYRWEWDASALFYDFSDGNDRRIFNTSGGYAYLMSPELEERVILSLSTSDNTEENTVYFNPDSDLSVVATHRTSLVYTETQFERHVDHFSLFAGMYDQDGYDTKATYGARVEQEYDINRFNTIGWGAEWASRVYDGDRESNFSLYLTINTKFL